MNLRLLELVNRYEDYGNLKESYLADAYLSLFTSPEAPVFCDRPSSPKYNKSIPVAEFVKTSLGDSLFFVVLKSVKRSEYIFSEGNWEVKLLLDRKISYCDAAGVNFTNESSLILNCRYFKYEEQFRIFSIEGAVKNPDHSLPWVEFPGQKFSVVQMSHPEDTSVFVQGKRLAFSEYGQAFTSSDSYEYSDDDVVLKKNVTGSTDAYTLYTFSYKARRFRLRFFFDYAPVSAFAVTSDIKSLESKSSAMSFGVEFGHMWPVSKSVKLGLNAGIGLSMSNLDLTAENESYSVAMSGASKTSDGYTDYQRTYRLSKVQEGMKFTDFFVPLYFSSEFRLARKVTMTLDVGPKLNLNAKMTLTPYSISGDVTDGYTGQTTPLSVDNRFMHPVSYRRKTYDLSVVGRIGLDFPIAGMHSIGFRIGYEYGISDTFKSDMNQWLSSDGSEVPVYYYKGKDVAVRSFADCISYRRNAIWFGIGYKLKF